MNLMNMAMKYVGPMVAQQIATKMGIGGPIANKLIAAALPTILGGVIGKSKTSGGLGSLMGMITGDNAPQPNMLESFLGGGGDVDELTKAGGGMLEGLLGGNAMGGLAGALGKYAGVDQAQAGSLMGMLAPVALGAVGSQVAEQGLDADGVASFLKGQEANVAQAMPAAFAQQLGGSGLLEGFGDSLGQTASAATQAASQAAAQTAKSSGSKLPLILGAAAVAVAGWFFLGRGGAPEMPEMPAMPDLSAISTEGMTVGDINVGDQLTSITGGLGAAFGGITDMASAEAAVPALTDLSGQLGTLGENASQLTGAAQTGFQGIVGTALGSLRPMIDGVIENSGAGSILQPIADNILGSLEGMAG